MQYQHIKSIHYICNQLNHYERTAKQYNWKPLTDGEKHIQRVFQTERRFSY